MSNYTTNASVNLNVNGKEAEETLARLKLRASDYKDAIAKAAKEGNQAELKKLRNELRATNREIKTIQSATVNVHDVLKRLDSATPKELKSTLKQLTKELNNMSRGTKDWAEQNEKIRRVKDELDSVNRSLKNQQTGWQKLSGMLQQWQTVAVVALSYVMKVVDSMTDSVNDYAQMEQEMANVIKYTGLTKEEVEELNEEFKKMDTRTSREDLNKLAQEAGRLGKTSKEDILGFVRAADQINVSLDDLGEGATLTLSKLTGIFGDEERLGTEKSLLAVGSVINELSQNCSASAPYLAEFASRMGGVGAQAGMTIQQIMGFAAVLDSNNQKVEASATALSQVITRMYKDPAKYAEPAGLEVKSFTKLLREDANAALILLLESLNRMGKMDVLSPVFAGMGETGSRAVSALSTLAGNIDKVRSQQEVANVAFAQATSIGKEFDVQNSTVQAGLVKSKKGLHELSVELGKQLAPAMSMVNTSTELFLKGIIGIVVFLKNYSGAIITLTLSVLAYNIAINAATIKTKALATAHAIAKTSIVALTSLIKLLSLGFTLLTGNITRARAEFVLFSRALKLSPIGVLVSIITAVVGALSMWIIRSKKLTEAQKQLTLAQQQSNDLEQKAQENATEELSRLKALYDATQNQTLSMKDRISAAETLKKQYPAYFEKLSTEEILTGKAASAYEKLKTQILETAKARAAESMLIENNKQIFELEQQRKGLQAQADVDNKEYETAVAEWDNARQQENIRSFSYTNSTDASSGSFLNVTDYAYKVEKAKEKKDASQAAYTANEAKITQLQEANETLTPVAVNNISSNTKLCPKCHQNPCICKPNADSPDNTDRFKAEKEWKEREEALNRIAYATGRKSYEDYTKRMNDITVDYYNKQLGHTDLSENERLSIQAKHAEAEMKQKEQNLSFSLEAETNAYNERLAEAKQFFIDGTYSLSTYNEECERIESEHLRNMVKKTKEGTKERIAAEKALADFEYQSALNKKQDTERIQADLKNKFFGENSVERKANYDNALANLTLVYEAELKATEGNAAEKLRIEEAYQKAKLALQKEYGQSSVEENLSGLKKINADIVDWIESDAGKAVTQSFDLVMSGMGAIFSQVSSLVQAELEIQTAAIEKRYDKEISLAEGNTYKVKKLEKQKEAEIAKAKNEANRKMFAMQVIQAVAQTATNAINAYGSAAAIPVVGYIMAPIAAAMAVAAGMLQIATIKKQQQAAAAQGYSQGGFTKPGAVDEPAGVVHAGEWVASQKLLASPVARPLIEALDYAQRTNTIGSLRSEDVSRAITAPIVLANNQSSLQTIVPQSSPTVIVEQNKEYASIMKKLSERLNEPFVTVNTVTGDMGLKKAQDEYNRLIKNKTPKSKRK